MESNVITKLENEIELLEKPQTEKELRVSPQLRQAQLDVSLLEPGMSGLKAWRWSCQGVYQHKGNEQRRFFTGVSGLYEICYGNNRRCDGCHRK